MQRLVHAIHQRIGRAGAALRLERGHVHRQGLHGLAQVVAGGGEETRLRVVRRFEGDIHVAEPGLLARAVQFAPQRFVTVSLRRVELVLDLQRHAARARRGADQFAFGIRHGTLRAQRLRMLAECLVRERHFGVQANQVVGRGRFGKPALFGGREVGFTDLQRLAVLAGVVPQLRLNPDPLGRWRGVLPAQRQAFVQEMLGAFELAGLGAGDRQQQFAFVPAHRRHAGLGELHQFGQWQRFVETFLLRQHHESVQRHHRPDVDPFLALFAHQGPGGVEAGCGVVHVLQAELVAAQAAQGERLARRVAGGACGRNGVVIPAQRFVKVAEPAVNDAQLRMRHEPFDGQACRLGQLQNRGEFGQGLVKPAAARQTARDQVPAGGAAWRVCGRSEHRQGLRRERLGLLGPAQKARRIAPQQQRAAQPSRVACGTVVQLAGVHFQPVMAAQPFRQGLGEDADQVVRGSGVHGQDARAWP